MKKILRQIAMTLIGMMSVFWAFTDMTKALLSIIILLLWLIYERVCDYDTKDNIQR